MSRGQLSPYRESIPSRPPPPGGAGLSTTSHSSSSAKWTDSEIGHQSSGQEFAEVSLGNLRERADRARAACYLESCKHHTLIPQLRALMQQAREISVTLRVERMRHGVLAVEVKRSLAIGSELYDAVSGQGRRAAKAHGTSVQ